MNFLGVHQSAKGFSWLQRAADTRAVMALERAAGLDEVTARLLAARGIGPEDLETFLTPRLRDLLPDPLILQGFEALAQTLLDAIHARETIGILTDYDVDGATSAAVMVACLRALGADYHLYVPDRLEEGYGPSDKAFVHFAHAGVKTVLTLDCGSMAHGPLHRAEAGGIRVLVIDHHQISGDPPRVTAHINPNQAGCISGIGTCAAVGVAFVVAVGLRRAAKERGLAFGIDLMQLLDLVALGTICDVVPLRGLNRAFVRQGLKVWAETQNPGLQALLTLLPKRPKFDGALAGFQIGPRLNAAGRVGPSDLAARILTTDAADEAQRLARELDRLNQLRRTMEAETLATARLALAQEAETRDLAINFVVNAAFHPGVVGIVAGRLKDATGKPSLVLGMDPEGKAVGSGRSVAGFDLGRAVLKLREEGLLLTGGGHAMAAGLKCAVDKIATVKAALEQAFLEATREAPEAGLGKVREIDLALSPAAATPDLAAFLSRLQPFGAHNPEPKVAIMRVRTTFMQIVGTNHIRVKLEDGAGHALSAIAFRAAGSNVETVLRQGREQHIHVAGSLTLDEWRGGDSAQLLIDDVALAS